MTALEYMEKQLANHRINFEHEVRRGAPKEQLENIRAKIGYYKTAVEALEELEEKWFTIKEDNIIQVLKAVVEHSGVRVETLARKADVTSSTMRGWLREKYRPRLDLFLLVCEAAGVKVEVRRRSK